jgi:hypothetical protein
MRRFIAGAAVLALGCGSNSTAPTPVSQPSPTPVTTLIFRQTSVITPAPTPRSVAFGNRDVPVTVPGLVKVVFDWTVRADVLQMVVTTPDCVDGNLAYANGCTTLGSDKTNDKPSVVSFSLSAPTNIRVWIYDFSTNPESAVLSVYLTQ